MPWVHTYTRTTFSSKILQHETDKDPIGYLSCEPNLTNTSYSEQRLRKKEHWKQLKIHNKRKHYDFLYIQSILPLHSHQWNGNFATLKATKMKRYTKIRSHTWTIKHWGRYNCKGYSSIFYWLQYKTWQTPSTSISKACLELPAALQYYVHSRSIRSYRENKGKFPWGASRRVDRSPKKRSHKGLNKGQNRRLSKHCTGFCRMGEA